MKKGIVLAMFVGLIVASTSCSQDKQMKSINDFARTYFPEAEVLSSIKDGFDYEVTLSDYTQIGFDGNMFGKFEWEEVDCQHASIYTVVPSALIPNEITNYVNRIHGTLSIVKISKDNRSWDIKLSNGIKIEFDKRFNVIDFDD